MDYIHDYFAAFRRAGIDTTFEIHRHNGESVVEKINFDHVTHDGLSAMLEIVRRFPAEGQKLPKVAVPKKPSLFKRLYELSRWYVRFFPFKPSLWKSRGETKMASASLEFPTPPHATLLNTRLLLSLDQTAKKYLVKPDVKRMWMLPVGLYPMVLRELPPLNRVSFVELSLEDKTTLSELEIQIKRELKSLSYWGTMLTMLPAKFMGQWFFALLSKYLHLSFRRTGTFSNMGEWTIPQLPENEWWSFGKGVVARMSPVEATAITVNGKLGVSIHFHASLGFTESDAKIFIEEWRKAFEEISR